jgi:methionyl-tRNA formyltransferase
MAKRVLARSPGNFNLKMRALHSLYPDLYPDKEIAQLLDRFKVELKVVDDVNSKDFVDWIKSRKPDLILSAAYPQIFRKPLLQAPNIGCVNSHPSLLPRCRGAHPVFWAILSGEKQSGVTAHYMTTSLDDGDIIAQRRLNIEPAIRYRELYDRIIDQIPKLIEEVDNFFLSGKRKGRSQDDGLATYFKNDRDIHRKIFFASQTAQEVDCIVRACDGNASFFYDLESIRVIKSLPLKSNRNLTNNIKVPAGTIIDFDENGPLIKTKDGIIQLMEILVAGKKISGKIIAQKTGWKIGMVIGQ